MAFSRMRSVLRLAEGSLPARIMSCGSGSQLRMPVFRRFSTADEQGTSIPLTLTLTEDVSGRKADGKRAAAKPKKPVSYRKTSLSAALHKKLLDQASQVRTRKSCGLLLARALYPHHAHPCSLFSQELLYSNQYLAAAYWFDDQNFKGIAKFLEKEAEGERSHAKAIFRTFAALTNRLQVISAFTEESLSSG